MRERLRNFYEGWDLIVRDEVNNFQVLKILLMLFVRSLTFTWKSSVCRRSISEKRWLGQHEIRLHLNYLWCYIERMEKNG